MNEDLKLIKKHYGEKMMHLCRELFSTLLETDGLLSNLMLDSFAPNKYLYEDIIDSNNISNFKNYIYSLVNVEKKEIELNLKTPKELLDEAGYVLYECKNEKEIQKFKKYYAKGEELCTFNGDRLKSCYVFFAVKKNVNEIKREDFEYPDRQDEYGTSVISIQFSKGKINTLSIKNRYNHTVNNPDATYSNNLENIIEGLTESFEKYYRLNINQCNNKEIELDGYIKANDGKYYKYNYEINNIYYCPDNIIIDNFKVKKYPKEKYIILDYFVLDLVNKKIRLYDKELEDSFINQFWILGIDKIMINKDKKSGNKIIEISLKSKNDSAIIEIDKFNQIIGYKNNTLEAVDDYFLGQNTSLQYLVANNLLIIGGRFLASNAAMKELELPNLRTAGYNFLKHNVVLESFRAPNLGYVGNNFLEFNKKITSLSLPRLEFVGEEFLYRNRILHYLDLPKLQKAGSNFLYSNKKLKKLYLPSLKEIQPKFMSQNEILSELNLPEVVEIALWFLDSNLELITLNLPKVEKVGSDFLYSNENLQSLEMPKLRIVGNNFLYSNLELTTLSLPKVEKVGSDFLYSNENLQSLEMPKLRIVGNDFLYRNQGLETLKLLNLENVNSYFLATNCTLKEIELPKLRDYGCDFLRCCMLSGQVKQCIKEKVKIKI